MWTIVLDYFISLAKMTSGRRIVDAYLDTPLVPAIRRSRIACFWAALFSLIGFCVYHSPTYVRTVFFGDTRLQPTAYGILLFIAFWLCVWIIGYGFLRLFTLVNHNLTTNLLKVRGQRLRLLNVYTTLLSLIAPGCVFLSLARWYPSVGFLCLTALALYALVILAYSYNTIFHRHGWQGFRLVVLGLLVTVFVLAIGALAIGVAVAVIAFLVVVLLRPVLHH